MRLVVQRVRRASVDVGVERIAEIGPGALVLVGIARDDDEPLAARMASKLVGLRYFRDEEGRTNRSIIEAGGALLVVSQFTLLADVRKGRRPGFTDAAPPERAVPILDRFVAALRGEGIGVQAGRFGAEMVVELANDGPFTLVIDSDRDLGSGPA
ncbi:MAG TPA: D-aminoacyl-tRNA deacylase [Candidatus Limnocylindria bacterium]|nr:D-aminoacyl-tRNA deacylase [Candidatus Limnocylindria bacterium]